jgi:hypothetical protein
LSTILQATQVKVNNLNAEASASGEDENDDIDWEEG